MINLSKDKYKTKNTVQTQKQIIFEIYSILTILRRIYNNYIKNLKY